MVAANGGSDLIYLPDGDRRTGAARRRCAARAGLCQRHLRRQQARPIRRHAVLDDIALEGTRGDAAPGDRGQLPLLRHGVRRAGALRGRESPTPACSRARACTAASAAPTPGISWPCRDPDFKAHFVDPAPVSNADVGRTIAQLLQLDVGDQGKLVGRVLTEALPNGAVPEVTGRVVTSEPGPNGLATVINTQTVGTTRYFDAGGFLGRTVGLSGTVLPDEALPPASR